MRYHRTLIAAACVALLTNTNAQNALCPGEPLVFQVSDEYYGTKTWEHSTDGVTWTTVSVIEDEPFVLQPEQSGWYRVRFHDEDCDIMYVSDAQRFVTHAIDLGDPLTLTIGGIVRNELGGPVHGATVRAGCGAGVSTTTDPFGVFLLDSITAYETLVYVTVEKDGYFTGSRSFVPGENAVDAISYTHITLLQKNLAGTVDGIAGGTVTLEGVNIIFPAGAFTQNGTAYTGTVNVFVNHIDPSSDSLHTQMPGMLMGVIDGQPQLLLSYGMVGVELTDGNGLPVQLTPGSPATVHFPVMPDQQADAPATIPLWWFDEGLGYWVQEGEAALVGNEYVGEVAHFSWWNCDVPGNFVELKGVVLDSVTGAMLPGAQIVISTQTMGSGITYTNTQGEFAGLVPIGEQLTISVQFPCGPDSAWTVHEEIVGPFAQSSALSLSVNTSQDVVTGTVVDCDGVPVDAGYVLVNGAIHFCTDGVFNISTCAASVTLRGVDLTTGNVSSNVDFELVNDTTDVDELVACFPFFGIVTDIEGNTYTTVPIGDQEWMAENLRTSTYANGELIPNITDGGQWSQFTVGPGWCSYENDASYDIYGKLYNWYAVSSANICPQEWHVPTYAEWEQLEVALGMPTDELGLVGFHGVSQNVGGKMKAITLWNLPNTGATNESFFSALPSGGRGIDANSNFYGLGTSCSWWTSTLNGTMAYIRQLYYSNSGIQRENSQLRAGYSVRCVRD